MKNLIVAIIACFSLIMAAPQVQAAPKALSTKQKQQYSQQTAALPAGFAQEQGEVVGETLLLVCLLLIVFAVTLQVMSGQPARNTFHDLRYPERAPRTNIIPSRSYQPSGGTGYMPAQTGYQGQ